MDEPFEWDKKLWFESFPKILRGGYQNRTLNDKPIGLYPFVYFADCKKPTKKEDIFTLQGDDIFFVWYKNTLTITLHILIWMGIKQIHLVGCDLGGEPDYYFGNINDEARRQSNKVLYRGQLEYLTFFHNEGRKHGVQLVSCSPESPLNESVPYLPLEEAISLSKRKIS